MNYNRREQLKELIAKRLDVHEFLDIIGWDMFDLVEEINEDVFDRFEEELERACG